MEHPRDVQVAKLDEELWHRAAGRTYSFTEEEQDLSAGAFQFRPGQRVPEKGFTAHEGTEVSLVLQGEVMLGSPRQPERRVRAGELVIIPRGMQHYSYNPGPETAHIVWVIAPAVKL